MKVPELEKLGTPELIAKYIADLYRSVQNSRHVIFAKLHLNQQTDSLWLQEITRIINAHRPIIEHSLNERLQLDMEYHEICIGSVNDTLYFWRRDINSDSWLNIYANETVYFRRLGDKQHLIDETRCHLGIKSDRSLGRLINQITRYPRKVPQIHVISDLVRNHPRVLGETLHFLLDASEQMLADIQTQIFHIGKGHLGRGRILNPRFPPIEPLRTRLLATMFCDGHLNVRRCLHYTENNPERREIVLKLVKQLGDVEYSIVNNRGSIRLNFPAVLGRLLEYWGLPVGDKVLQNIGLPPTITRGSPTLKRIYLQELIPEEGSFISRDSCFRWSRSVVLISGPKGEKYDFKPKINEECIQLISKFGTPMKCTFGGDKARTVIRLIWGTLLDIKESRSKLISDTAEKLEKKVLSTPPQLLEDEVALCKGLGIEISHGPVVVNSFESGRISVTWHAVTASIADSVLWAKLAPPRDERKRALVDEMLSSRS